MEAEARLVVAGLGPAGLDLLPAQSLRVLERAPRLVLRTARHPAAEELAERGVRFEALDGLYESASSLTELYPALAEAVLGYAREGGVVYAVPGHPLLGEESVRLALARAREEQLPYQVLPAPGFVDVVLPALAAALDLPDLTDWQVADGAGLARLWWHVERPVLIFQVDEPAVASRVKLALLEEYPAEWQVSIVRRAGTAAQEVRTIPLHALDRPEAGAYDHLTALFLPPLSRDRRRPAFSDLVAVVARLREPGGCPWDREQTHVTLKRFVLEEAYEVLDAVDAGDPAQLCDELGDLLLQVVLYARLGEEAGEFDLRDVVGGIVEKLIRRHPHVFGEVAVDSSEDVLRNWEAIKRTERPERESVLDGIPRTLPALLRAMEASKRVVRLGFEWPHLDAVLAKLDEELRELRAEVPCRDPERLAQELGDLLFTVVNVARWLKVDPEDALRRMVERFGRRFREVERLAREEGRSPEELGAAELEALWERAKATVA
jgi:tetrapyrrole methylase family protein/MazG family protein